jgi:predicted dehydrogenase
VEVERRDAMRDEIAAFAACVEHGTEPPISNRYARAIVEAMLAVEESSRTGREVRLG